MDVHIYMTHHAPKNQHGYQPGLMNYRNRSGLVGIYVQIIAGARGYPPQVAYSYYQGERNVKRTISLRLHDVETAVTKALHERLNAMRRNGRRDFIPPTQKQVNAFKKRCRDAEWESIRGDEWGRSRN